jgi:O-antigen/teichoic acid export membrane protein
VRSPPIATAGVPRADTARLAHRVLAGVAWITLAGAVGRLFSLFSAPILTALISPSEYGVVALVSTVVSLASTVGLCGVDFSYGRFWAGLQDSEHESIERFCWRFAVASSLVFAASGSILWFTLLAAKIKSSPLLALMVGLGIVLSNATNMANIRARFQGAYWRLAAASIATAGLSALVTIALALCWRPDAWAILTGTWVGMMTGLAVLGTPRLHVLRSALPVDPQQQRKIFEFGFAGMTMAAMYWVTNSSDRWFIGVFRDQTELGLYSFGNNIGMLGLVLNSALTAAWFPEITRSYEGQMEFGAPQTLGREWARLVSTLLLVWLAVASAGGDVIRLLAHPQFHDSTHYVPWIAAGVFFHGVSSLANTGLWVSHKMKRSAYWWLAGASVSIALNMILVPVQGATGAAVTSCASYAFIAGGVLWSAQRSFPLQIPWRRLLASSALVLVASMPMTIPWHPSPLYSLYLKFPVGLVVSAIVLYASSPDWSKRTAIASVRWLRQACSRAA